jgi:hypothetical protein
LLDHDTSDLILSSLFVCCWFSAKASKDQDDDAEEEDSDEDDTKEEEDEDEDKDKEAEEAAGEELANEENKEVEFPEATMKVVTKAPAAGPTSSPFNMSFFAPYILYTYIEDDDRMITIDLLVVGQAQENYRPKVVNDGQVLQLGMVIPSFFANEDRLQTAHYHDNSFNEDTHKATALREVVAKHTDDAEDPLIGEPMQIKLPFKVVDGIEKCELLAFDNTEEFSKETGNQQYFFVLTIDLVGVDKVKKEKKAATFRMLGSVPAPKPAASPVTSSIRASLFGTPKKTK